MSGTHWGPHNDYESWWEERVSTELPDVGGGNHEFGICVRVSITKVWDKGIETLVVAHCICFRAVLKW